MRLGTDAVAAANFGPLRHGKPACLRPRRRKPAAWRISAAPVTVAAMVFLLTGLPLWISAPIIVGGSTLLAMLGPTLVRRYVALDRLTINNEIAGFKFATVGVLYAVLLAFVVIVVWEKFSDAEANVVREAGAAENLYRLSLGLAILVGPTCAKPSPPISRRRWRTTGRPWTGDRARWRTRQAGARRNYRMLSVVNDQRNRAVVAEIFRQLDRMTEARSEE